MKSRSFGSIISAIALGLSSVSTLSAMEFNEVGHKALGMGGVGVAVKNSPYGLFFNPALLGAKPGTKIGYSIGGAINHKNMFELLNYNLSAISDVNGFNELLKDNNVNVKFQAALVLQLPETTFGNFAIGYTDNAYAFASFGGYLASGQNDLNQASLTFDVKSIGITEIPIGYGYQFKTLIGDISTGIAVKFMDASYGSRSKKFDKDFNKNDLENTVIKDAFKVENNKDSSIGVDLGVTYAPRENFTIGLVGKNLNTPTFSFADTQIKVRPQARLGIGYELSKSVTIAADADLTNNDVWNLTNSKLQSQKIGVGVDADFTFFDIRAGVAKDLRQDNGAILSAGLGLGFVDVAVAFSTQKGEFNGSTIPQYVALQIGGGFVF